MQTRRENGVPVYIRSGASYIYGKGISGFRDQKHFYVHIYTNRLIPQYICEIYCYSRVTNVQQNLPIVLGRIA